MDHKAGGSLPEDGLQAYFAKEGVDPLTGAFDKKNAVHPGGMGQPIPKDEESSILAGVLGGKRKGKTAAYIHVPFCQTHCLFCGFFKKGYNEKESALYTDALILELQLWADKPAQQEGPIHAVYFGGGTPTALEAVDLKRLLVAIPRYLPLANDCEITMEGRVHNFGPEKMEACLAGGVNRFSLGVQTFDTKLRQSMRRVADKDTIISALSHLRDYDQAAIVIDLIYGFPDQTLEMWEEDLQIFLDLGLDGVDLYQLNIFPNTPLYTAIQKERMAPGLDIPTRAKMYARGCEVMADNHYRRLSVNHWGRTTRERNIYNQLMRSPSNCLAFGPSAGGSIGAYSYMTQGDYANWKESVFAGQKPIAMLMNNGPHHTLKKTITGEFELCRINLKAISTAFGLDIHACLRPLFDQWTSAGLMEQKRGWAILTTAGQFWQVNLSQLSLNYLQKTLLRERKE